MPASPEGKRGPRKVNLGLSTGCGSFVSRETKLLLPQVIFPVWLKRNPSRLRSSQEAVT